MSDDKKPNLYQRINVVRQKVQYLKKEKEVQNYKAVTHDQVTAMVRDHLVSNGIVILPTLLSTSSHDAGVTSKGTPVIRVEVVYAFKFVNMDDPTETETCSVSAHALDQGDKAPGKALSYAKKAMILKVFEIETGEDDESRFDEKGLSSSTLADHLAAIEVSADLESLKGTYFAAQKAATQARDKEALKIILKAKDERKAQLTENVVA